MPNSGPSTPLDGAHCNALLLAHCSVRQKLNHVNSVQLSRSVRALKLRGACQIAISPSTATLQSGGGMSCSSSPSGGGSAHWIQSSVSPHGSFFRAMRYLRRGRRHLAGGGDAGGGRAAERKALWNSAWWVVSATRRPSIMSMSSRHCCCFHSSRQ